MKATMKLYLAIGVGGSIGSVLRYLISVFFEVNANGLFPWETFIVNIIGTFLLAFFVSQPAIKIRLGAIYFTALTVGLIGSFSTVSAMTVEIFMLWGEHVIIAVLYITSNFIGAFLVALLGFRLAAYRERRGDKNAL